MFFRHPLYHTFKEYFVAKARSGNFGQYFSRRVVGYWRIDVFVLEFVWIRVPAGAGVVAFLKKSSAKNFFGKSFYWPM